MTFPSHQIRKLLCKGKIVPTFRFCSCWMLMGKPRHPKLSFKRTAGDKGEVCANDIETWRLGLEISADKLSAGKIHWSIPISSPN
jgi:hypothetical protein